MAKLPTSSFCKYWLCCHLLQFNKATANPLFSVLPWSCELYEPKFFFCVCWSVASRRRKDVKAVQGIWCVVVRLLHITALCLYVDNQTWKWEDIFTTGLLNNDMSKNPRKGIFLTFLSFVLPTKTFCTFMWEMQALHAHTNFKSLYTPH